MHRIILVTFAFFTNALAYHDPDLNYHLSQVQNTQGCGDGYSYPTPAVQLTPKETFVPKLIQTSLSSNVNSYSNAGGYSQNVLFGPKVAYTQPTISYPTPILANVNVGSQSQYVTQNEAHGYQTSAGLSSATTRTVIPQATYAQAPIIAKITAAPLQAKFSILPSKKGYYSQNSISQSAFSSDIYGKATLNAYSNDYERDNPVVSQVYAAPKAQYTTSPALRVQTSPVYNTLNYHQNQLPAVYRAPVAQYSNQYSASSATNLASSAQYTAPAQYTVTQYSAAPAQYAVPQYRATPVAHYTPAVPQYTAPIATQYTGLTVNQYAAPTVIQHTAAAVAQHVAPVVTQHVAPVVTQHVAPVVTQHVAPVVTQQISPAAQYAISTGGSYSAPIKQAVQISQYSSPAAQVSHITAPVMVAPVAHLSSTRHAVKNVHTEFLENY